MGNIVDDKPSMPGTKQPAVAPTYETPPTGVKPNSSFLAPGNSTSEASPAGHDFGEPASAFEPAATERLNAVDHSSRGQGSRHFGSLLRTD